MTRYALYIDPEVHQLRRDLPGMVRQRIKAAFDDLASDPRSSHSRSLNIAGLEIPAGIELRRLRMDKWRIIYAVHDEEAWVWVLAIRQRPPYEYDDLADLVAQLG